MEGKTVGSIEPAALLHSDSTAQSQVPGLISKHARTRTQRKREIQVDASKLA